MLLRFSALLITAFLVGFAPTGSLNTSVVTDDLIGTWSEESATLRLDADGNATIDGAPATWRRFGSKKLRFKRGGEVERPRFTLEGNKLTVQWKDGAKTYERAATGFPEIPPALEAGKKEPGKGKLWKHPRDYFTCVMPERWRVEAIDDWVMVVDPGLKGKETLEAIVFVGWGELEGKEKGKTPVQLMQQYEGEWLRQLAADGLRLGKAKAAPRRVLVGDVPGAEQEWSGKAQNGQKIRLWSGGIVKRDAFLYVAALAVEGKEAEYFPKAKHLFLSVIPTPPERNRKLEQKLAGKAIASTENNASGGTGWQYSFRDDGSVKSFWYLTGVVGLDVADANQEEWGSYEIFGDALYIYLKSGQIEGRVETDRTGNPVALVLKGGRYSL